MRINPVVASVILLGFAGTLFAQSGVKNNLVKPIQGPGPVGPGTLTPNYIPRPVVIDPPPVIVKQPEYGARRSPAYTARYLSNQAIPSFVPRHTIGRPVCDTSSANWGLSTSSIRSNPWWRGSSFTTREQWRLLEPAYSHGTPWWTTEPDTAFGRPCETCDDLSSYPSQYYVDHGVLAGPTLHAGSPRRYIVIDELRAARPPAAVSLDEEWSDESGVPSAQAIAPRPRRDVRPDLRRVARLTGEQKYTDAVDTLRRAVVEEPEAFTGKHGNLLLNDREAEQKLRYALQMYQSPPRGLISDVDGQFMIAAINAVLGDHEQAASSIRVGREIGEDRPSGRALYRVLTRSSDVEGQP